MIRMFNITTCDDDMARYRDTADIERFTAQAGLDGIEVMPYGENSLSIIPQSLVKGIHLRYHNSWYDYCAGNREAVIAEYGTIEEGRKWSGGDMDAQVEELRAELKFAQATGAEYVVYHVTNVTIDETITYRFSHTDEQIIDGAAEIINRALEGSGFDREFLVENLWWPGFTFTRPEMTERLLSAIRYPRTGIMLDTGHLMHTDPSIDTPEAGVEYINACLDRHGEMSKRIRGIHLHSGATGEFLRGYLKNPVPVRGSYFDRLCAVYESVLKTDRHVPLVCGGARALVDRIAPEYLTYEFITESRAQHMQFLLEQDRALGYAQTREDI